MTASPDPKVSYRPLLVFSIVAALVVGAGFYVVRNAGLASRRLVLDEKDLRLSHTFKSRLEQKFSSLRGRMEAAEFLVSSSPPSPGVAARALSHLLESGEEGPSAAVVLDQSGKIISSKRQGGVPRADFKERRIWARSVAALQGAKGKGPKYHIEAEELSGVPVLFLSAPSAATGGYWGVILQAKSLFRVWADELSASESVFLLSEPEQMVLFAQRGPSFASEAIGKNFNAKLSTTLEVSVCCDPAAFNTVYEDERSMIQLGVPGGTRQLRLVLVTNRRGALAPAGGGEGRILAAGAVVAWVLLVGLFAVFQRRRKEESDDWAADRLISISQAGPPPAAGGGQFLELLSRVSDTVAKGAHFRDVISLIASQAMGVVGARRAYAALYDEGMQQMFEVYAAGLGDGYRAAIAMGPEEMPEKIAVREGEMVEVPAVREWAQAPAVLEEENVGAVVVFPMQVDKRLLGILALYFDGPHELREDEIEICSTLVQQGALAVDRALYQAAPPL
ncbi:MAG: GAF domain-containing protein [bacterium]|nr:GAF domain-containing protein [bacterium]